MKLLYVINRDMSKAEDGVVKKINMQIKALSNLGIDIDIWNLFIPKASGNYKKLLSRLPLFPVSIMWNEKKCLSDIDILYIRKPNIDIWFINFLRRIKSLYPFLKIVLELPTYPYDREYKDFKTYPYLLKERFWRRYLRYYLTNIVTYSEDNEIFGIKTIQIDNGINISEYEARKSHLRVNNINLLGVANVSKWHGYDRVITGMAQFLKKEGQLPYRFHIVGEGKELLNLKKIVEKNKLNKYVFFYGQKQGNELNKLYNFADIGVGSLAIHRKGISKASSLKTREYLAKGLPVIEGEKDAVFKYRDANLFCFPIDYSENPLNLYELMCFYEEANRNRNLIKNVRNFAEEHLSWEMQMRKVIEGTINNE